MKYRWAALTVLVVSTLSCDDRTPTAGTVARAALVNLVSPDPPDGGIVIRLSGPDLSFIKSASPTCLVYTRPGASQEVVVVVVGKVTPGPLLTLAFRQPRDLNEYHGIIEQVAMPADTLRAGLEGYAVTITPDR